MTDEPHLIRRLLPFERDFTQIPNQWMRDESISFRARGILASLMTHESGWKVTLKNLARATPTGGRGEGVDGLRAAVLELEKAGYLRRHPVARGGRFIGDVWEVCDPTAVSDPTLFGTVDNSPATALAQPTRKKTALAQATRTALAQATPRRTQVKNNRRAPQGAPASSDSPDLDLWTTCPSPSSPDGRHEFDGPGLGAWCIHCARVRRDGSLYDRHGRPLPPATPTPTTSKEVGHAVAS